MDLNESSLERVMIVGSGWHYTSGISHYTYRLSSALKADYPVSALLMRRLVPKCLYPGRKHAGITTFSIPYPSDISVYDGVDWNWGKSLAGALEFIDRQKPTVLILQWWTGAVLHSYLKLVKHAVRNGARVILEWHEGQDVGEAAFPGARRYVQTLMPRLLSYVDAHVVHSAYDLEAITKAYNLKPDMVSVIPHGPYDHLTQPAVNTTSSRRDDGPFKLLYLGVVRPYKGVEDLVTAFSSLDRTEAKSFRLSIVGEAWEGWTAPAKAIARSPHADLIERIDRYVSDTELTAYFEQADAVVLPYHRSSASGPLHIAMSAGLPVVVTSVGGLTEAVQEYPGARLVPPRDPVALRQALLELPKRRGERYSDPHSWQRSAVKYVTLIDRLHSADGRPQSAEETHPENNADSLSPQIVGSER